MPLWWNGRHARFRTWWPKGRGGSSPLKGTKITNVMHEIENSDIAVKWISLWIMVNLLEGKNIEFEEACDDFFKFVKTL